MTLPMPSSSDDQLSQLSHVLNQFHQDIHQLRRGRGQAKQVFGRDEYTIFASASEQANNIIPMCDHEMALQLSPFQGKKAHLFLGKLSMMAKQFLNKIKLKYRGLCESEEALLEYLEPKIKHAIDTLQSYELLTQSQKTPSVILGSRDDYPIVCGKTLPKLTSARYEVIKALIAAERPLTKDQLVNESGKGDAVNILKRMAKNPDWGKVIQLAGSPGIGYSLKR